MIMSVAKEISQADLMGSFFEISGSDLNPRIKLLPPLQELLFSARLGLGQEV
jgi:hypothetical protein